MTGGSVVTLSIPAERLIEARDDAPDYGAFAAAPERWRGIAGAPPELAKRVPGFAASGVDPDRIVAAIRAAGPEKGPATPGWAEKIAAVGEEAFEQGEAAERAGDAGRAEKAFLEASFWFFLARFPHILGPAGAAAYRRHNDAYMRAAGHFADAVERISFTFDGGAAVGLLRLPREADGPVPLALMMGGIDVWKSDLEIHRLAERLLKHGVATLAIDIPGTGECPVPVSATGERPALAALARIRSDMRIDPARIGVYGLSFGGHFATKLAIVEPSLKAVVQNGGPIHYAFGAENLRALPFGTRAALGRIVEADPAGDPAAFERKLASLSLAAQGLLPARAHAPLLSIDGARDELVPIRDLRFLEEQGVRHDALVFAEDRHCASANRSLHEPFAIEWMARRLCA
jgi:esterase FrsA